MKLEIRRAHQEDASKIIIAHRRSIRELCSKDYTLEQIAAWAGINFQEERWRKTIDQDMVWVISDRQDNIFGFGHMQFHGDSEAEVRGLYFVPEATKKGFGKEIFKLMFEECKKKNIQTVHLIATRTAKAFYEKMGLKQVGSQSSLKIGDQDIECFKMQMSLI